jgi:starvation-inducible DNA-binding protein
MPDFLSRHLKSQIIIMNQTRNTLPPPVRKNVRGTTFIGLHKLLDEFGGRILTRIDLAAERATALGGIVEGTLRESVKHSNLKKKEEPSSISGISDWIRALADFHAEAGERVRKAIKRLTDAEDFGTADLLTDILRALELQLWLLEAHINQQQPEPK